MLIVLRDIDRLSEAAAGCLSRAIRGDPNTRLSIAATAAGPADGELLLAAAASLGLARSSLYRKIRQYRITV